MFSWNAEAVGIEVADTHTGPFTRSALRRATAHIIYSLESDLLSDTFVLRLSLFRYGFLVSLQSDLLLQCGCAFVWSLVT